MIFTLMILAPIGILLAVVLVYTPTFLWENLTPQEKSQLRNLSVQYSEVDVKLGDLFDENSTFLNFLTSPQISDGLEGESEKITKALNSNLDQYIFLVWNNMTEGLKKKCLRATVNFQGFNLTLGEILDYEYHENTSPSNDTLSPSNNFAFKSDSTLNQTSLFNVLTANDIKILLHNNSFKIEEKFNPKLDFYVTRNFYKRTSGQNQLIRNRNENVSSTLSAYDIIKNTEISKIFILSDGAGTGKSTSLKIIALKVKEIGPNRWVSYFDLKKYSKDFEVSKNFFF